MRNAPSKNRIFHKLSREMSFDPRFPSPSPRFIAEREAHSQMSEETGQNGTSSNLEDVAFLRLAGVKEMTGLSKSCLYLLIRENSFPAPVRIGNRAVAWVRSEVRDWALERIAAPR